MLLRRSGASRERWLSENSHGGKICTTYAGCEAGGDVSSATTAFDSCDRKKGMTTHLIGARIGHIDDSSCLFCLQVGDERAL